MRVFSDMLERFLLFWLRKPRFSRFLMPSDFFFLPNLLFLLLLLFYFYFFCFFSFVFVFFFLYFYFVFLLSLLLFFLFIFLRTCFFFLSFLFVSFLICLFLLLYLLLLSFFSFLKSWIESVWFNNAKTCTKLILLRSSRYFFVILLLLVVLVLFLLVLLLLLFSGSWSPWFNSFFYLSMCSWCIALRLPFSHNSVQTTLVQVFIFSLFFFFISSSFLLLVRFLQEEQCPLSSPASFCIISFTNLSSSLDIKWLVHMPTFSKFSSI